MRHMLIVFVTFALLVISCKQAKKPEVAITVEEKPPMAVNAVRVSRGLVPRSIGVSGIASGIQEVTVNAETMGKIRSVNFTLGSKVSKGTELLTVDGTVLKAALEQAKSAYVSTELQYNIAKKLFDNGNASEAELRNAEVQKTAAAASVESAQKSVNDTRITAPISGFIAMKDNAMTVGNFLAAGVPVTKIIDISTLKATILVSEHDVVNIKEGILAEIYVSALRKFFKGKVQAISPGNMGSSSFPVEIVWSNTPDLAVKSGMSVKVTIDVNLRDSAVLIPIQSVIEKEMREAVFVNVDSKAVIKFIITGRTVGSFIEIIEGLNPGEMLLTSGMTVLARGDKITVTVTGESVGGN